ncbi:Uncharacterised protein [Mycobacteroides abscessus subsp. abscessus]|nr:Uncharacterised protein [Mycobacteroides abscessus subsp. abscessus]
MNATSSGVAFSAAKIRSPSFSRSSSSTTTTALPAAMSAMARSTVSSSTAVCVPVSSVTGLSVRALLSVLICVTSLLLRPRVSRWYSPTRDVRRTWR